MASPSLTDREKEINKFISHLNIEEKITPEAYCKAENRNQITYKYRCEDFDMHYYSNEILPNDVESKIIDDAISKAKATEMFFGFALWRVNLNLLLDLASVDYANFKINYISEVSSNHNDEESYMQDIENQLEEIDNNPYVKDFYSSNPYIDIWQQYQDWKNYCDFIDEIPNFMNKYYKGFSTFRQSKRDKIIASLENTSITAPIAEYLKEYSNLTKSKRTTAKEDKLLSLNLPKLNTKEIVKRFVNIYTEYKDTQI